MKLVDRELMDEEPDGDHGEAQSNVWYIFDKK